MQPSELGCADSSKTTDRPSPSITGPASAIVCGSDRVVSVQTNAGEPELELMRQVFAKCLIKTFVVSCDEGVPKLNATS